MKTITLRNLPPDLVRAIRRKAKIERTSINQTVIHMLQERVGSKILRARYHDLDALAGNWSERQAAEFERYLACQRRIDPEHWK